MPSRWKGLPWRRLCYSRGAVCLVIRSLSDRTNSHAVIDLLALLSTTARNSARLVRSLVEAL